MVKKKGDVSAGDAATQAVKSSRLTALTEEGAPTGAALWTAVGKSRGVMESLTPGLGFLGVYALTADVLLSVMAPVMVAIGFIAARLLTRTQVMPAVAGLIGITASASVAILSGRAEDNFLLGFVVNALWIAALLVSLILRRPLAGWVVSVLRGDPTWRKNMVMFRVAVVATWMWVIIFGLRLTIQIPLYLAGEVSALAIAKLGLGVPLYAAGLWFTWLLFRNVASKGESVVQ
jgi:hypothetical protein